MKNYFKSQKGFTQIPILIAIIVGIVVVGGGSYFGYIQLKDYQAQQNEKEKQIQELAEIQQKASEKSQREIEKLREEIKQEIERSAQQLEEEKERARVAEIQRIKEQEEVQEKITLSNAEIIERVGPAVVFIETDNTKGTGMFIESTGFVLTNAHVVTGVSTAKINLSNNRTLIALVVGRDEKVDLAILKVDGDNFPKVELGDSDKIVQGDEVFALGYPFGLEGDVSFKEGTISRKISDGEFVFLETSVEIYPGNSGGPLVDKYGQVIGVNTAIFGKNIKGVVIGETIKFAIPINIAKIHISELKNGRVVLLPVDSRKAEYEEFKKFKNEYLTILSDAFSFYDLEKEALTNWKDGNHYVAVQKTEQAVNILDVAMEKLSVIMVPKLPFSNIIEELVQLQLDTFSLDKERNEAEKLRYDFFLNSAGSEFTKLEIWFSWEVAKDVENYIKKLQIEREQYSDQLSEKIKQYTQNVDEYFE